MPPGRFVQCARCSKRWTPVAPLPAAPPPAVPASVIKPALAELPPLQPRTGASLPSEPPPVFRPASQARVAAMAWVLSLALLAAAAGATLVYRASIMQAWPPSQRAYAALGLR